VNGVWTGSGRATETARADTRPVYRRTRSVEVRVLSLHGDAIAPRTPADWYRDFFKDIALDVWRDAIPPSQTASEAAFLVRALRLRKGARVLDVPCGAGRLTYPLQQHGLLLTGVDLADEQIAEARRRASADGVMPRIEWRQADVRDLPWKSAFDAAFCFGNSFGYLDRDGTRAFVQALARALKPGGRFAMDTGMVAETLLPALRDHDETTIGGVRFIEDNTYHADASCLETRYTFVRDGVSRTRVGLHWVFTTGEIGSFFADAGMRVTELYGSLDETPFAVGDRLLYLVAEKR
jgi:SAM-dependent methyltransferase